VVKGKTKVSKYSKEMVDTYSLKLLAWLNRRMCCQNMKARTARMRLIHELLMSWALRGRGVSTREKKQPANKRPSRSQRAPGWW
jgi:hypothetical protein